MAVEQGQDSRAKKLKKGLKEKTISQKDNMFLKRKEMGRTIWRGERGITGRSGKALYQVVKKIKRQDK